MDGLVGFEVDAPATGAVLLSTDGGADAAGREFEGVGSAFEAPEDLVERAEVDVSFGSVFEFDDGVSGFGGGLCGGGGGSEAGGAEGTDEGAAGPMVRVGGVCGGLVSHIYDL
ncbi:hypothetical protein [Halalkalicoccus jeotgali]|nr:hypothetical protein [Halalkalicoccus jeotgali]